MKDYVRSAIARNLGVPEGRILLWRLVMGAGSRRGGYSSGPGPIEAELEVKLMDVDPQALQAHQPRSSLVIREASAVVMAGERQLVVDITLCYGKDTQHLFKAIHQTMTVRGPTKRKNK